jgi:hypothetical protein
MEEKTVQRRQRHGGILIITEVSEEPAASFYK